MPGACRRDAASLLGCCSARGGRRFACAGTTSTFSRRDGRFFVNTDGPDGRLADYEIKYAFGVRPLQQYPIELPAGRLHALGIAWDSRPKAQGVTCSDCHEPHSLQLRAPGIGVCAQCHLPARFDTARHTHHAEGTPGAACAACHMPTTIYMGVDSRHDHSMRVPRPDAAAHVGAPIACNNRHAKKTPQWAADAIRQWTGKAPAGYQIFAAALRAGSLGAPGALLGLIEDRSQPALVRQQQTTEGLKALRTAAQLAPESARFAHVYAAALHDTDRAKGAIKVLAAALKRDPYDRDVLSGLAHFTAQSGNRELALGYVRQLRELDPENPQYAQTAKQIEGAAR